ncbi:hypothetical protein E2986_02326 [Frieseomelitta varia]|uniref:Uncharacterized protein n=1 Tax=Frieseomelitta varia TaxID=561572 RepID=A0A833VN79_9HYME|nr:hypothetical protein E2986_02326 [Frieseomelitta varia]
MPKTNFPRVNVRQVKLMWEKCNIIVSETELAQSRPYSQVVAWLQNRVVQAVVACHLHQSAARKGRNKCQGNMATRWNMRQIQSTKFVDSILLLSTCLKQLSFEANKCRMKQDSQSKKTYVVHEHWFVFGASD